MVEVSGNQVVLGNDDDRIAELGEDAEHPAGEFQPPLNWLVTIRHTRHRQRLRLPVLSREFLSQQLGSAFFHHDLRLEVQSSGKSKVLVAGTRETIRTAVLTTTVCVDARAERNI